MSKSDKVVKCIEYKPNIARQYSVLLLEQSNPSPPLIFRFSVKIMGRVGSYFHAYFRLGLERVKDGLRRVKKMAEDKAP